MSKLWGGRFSGQMDAHMARFNASLPFDWRLWEADIAGSIAWAKAIAAAGLLTGEERDQIVAGLEAFGPKSRPTPRPRLPAQPTKTFTPSSSAG